MNEEILRIMKMLEEGKITAEQATALATAVKDRIPGQKMLQVRVLSEIGDKSKSICL